MAKYKKDSVVVEAFRFTHKRKPNWFWEKIRSGEIKALPSYCFIITAQGQVKCNWGDYLIKDAAGKVYPCNPETFEANYESFDEAV